MRRLRWNIALLFLAVAGLALLFAASERVAGLRGVSPLAVAFAIVLGAGACLVPKWRRVAPASGAVVLTLGYLAIKMGMAALGYGADRPAALGATLELIAVFACAWFALRAADAVSEFEDAVTNLWLTEGPGGVDTLTTATPLVRREIARARRIESSLAVTVFSFDAANMRADMDGVLRDVQQLLLRRVMLVRLSQLLADAVRRSDVLMVDPRRNRFVVLSPDTDARQGDAFAERLQNQVFAELGIELAYGNAALPHQGVTFDTLLAEAERNAAPLSSPPPRVVDMPGTDTVVAPDAATTPAPGGSADVPDAPPVTIVPDAASRPAIADA